MFRTRPTRRRVPSIEALEPRLLFSADPVGATDAVAAAWTESLESGSVAWQAPSDAHPAASQADAGTLGATRELVVLDARVPDADRLLAEFAAQRDAGHPIDVLLVGEGDDAIAALGEALSGSAGTYGAVHLFGHGEPGSMQLGDGLLDLATLRARAGEVAGWSTGLADGADLLLWGCDAGEGAEGAALLDALAALTGADVAASTDATGGLAAGGDWELEAARGSIETTVPIGTALRAEFAGLLEMTSASAEVSVAASQTPQETTGSTSTAGRQVAASAAGSVVVWIDADGERILAQRYAANGSLQGGVITIHEDDDEGAEMPAVAMDDAGNLLVAWSSDGEVRACFVSAAEANGGRTDFDDTSLRLDDGDDEARSPGQVSVDLSPDGLRAVVVWVEVEGINQDISARRLAISPGTGATLSGSKIDITQAQSLYDDHPDAGIANDGAITVVLHSSPSLFNSTSGIFSFRVAAGSSTPTPSANTVGARVSPTVPAYTDVQISPAFALGADGRGLAVWVDTRDGSLWSRVIGPSGPTGSAVKIPTQAGTTAGRPSVAAVAEGGWVVAWDTTSGTSLGYGIRAIRVDSTGAPDANGPITVDSTATGDQRAPSVAVAGSRVVIGWTGPGGGQAGTSALVMRTYVLDGELAIDAVPTATVPENAAASPITLRASLDGVTQTGVTWSLPPDAPAGLLSLDAATGVLTVLAGLDYETLPGGIELGGGQRAYDVDVTATLGGGTPRSATTTVRIVLGNVHEAALPQVPGPLAAVEDVPRVLSVADGSAVSIQADAAATRLDLMLSVDRGTLTLATVAGLDFDGTSDGTDDGTIRFGGSPAAVAAALASLTFRPPADAAGAAVLTLSVSDLGVGGFPVHATVTLTIAAVNDAPVAQTPTQALALESGSSAPVVTAALAATDVDDATDRIVYELLGPPSLGDLRLDGTALAVGGRFTQADVDLGRVTFAAREAGTANVSLRLADAGGAVAGSTTLAIEVRAPAAPAMPEADAPVAAPAAAAAAPEPEPEPAPAARSAAAQAVFVTSRASASFASLSSVTQADGAGTSPSVAQVAQSATAAAADGADVAPGSSAPTAPGAPANVVVRVGTGGTGAVAAASAPTVAPVGAGTGGGTAGGSQGAAQTSGGIQQGAAFVMASAAGSAGGSGAGAQLAWHDARAGGAPDAAGSGSHTGSPGGGAGGG
ncbi:MAG: DUF4347 domain-containing protein, partial [Burkholderiales bacterium]